MTAVGARRIVSVRRKDNRQVTGSQSCAELLHQDCQILLFAKSFTTKSVGAMPLPIDVDTCEVPLLEKAK